MHNNSLPPSDRDDLPAAAIARSPGPKEVLSTFTTEKGKVRSIFKCNTALREHLIRLRDASGSIWSNNKISNQLGISSAIISQYLNERGCIYDGDISKLERAVDDFLRNEERRRVSGIDTNQFGVADQILATFNRIRATNTVAAVVGEAGVGKTRGTEMICKGNPLAILFRVRAWTCDKFSLLAALWEIIPQVGYNPQTKRASFVVNSLRGTNRPLLIDDAHKLTRPALHLLFDIYDETNIPILLLGTEELTTKLQDDAQRFSRVAIYWPLLVSAEDRKALLTHQIRSIAKGVNGDFKDLLALCETVAMHHGCFRSVEYELKEAAELIAAKPSLTWPEAFEKAHLLMLRQYKLS